MKQNKWILTITSILLLAGCQSTTVVIINPKPSFHDNLFPEYQNVEIETEAEVFFINEKMKTFVDKNISHLQTTDKNIQALANGIFDHSNLNLLYQNDANTVAEQTFNNRAANCLSLTIMTYALADYANFSVHFQQVDTPELWVRREGNNLLNKHVNLRLFKKTKSNVVYLKKFSYQLDFDRRAQSLRLPAKLITKNRVLAMFYNNKGADALIKDNYTGAYAYFRSALSTDPMMIEGWTNLGLLYRRVGSIELAEETYLRALSINKDDATTLVNIAHIYRITGREEKAEHIRNKIELQRKNNPFYYFILGEVAYEKQDWTLAINQYKKAIRLDKKQHQFYFSLAKTYYKTGNIKQSKKFMALAKKYSQMDDLQLLYQGKLEQLSDIEM